MLLRLNWNGKRHDNYVSIYWVSWIGQLRLNLTNQPYRNLT